MNRNSYPFVLLTLLLVGCTQGPPAPYADDANAATSADDAEFQRLEFQTFIGLAKTIEALTPQELSGRTLAPRENWEILAGMSGRDIELVLIDDIFLSKFIAEPRIESEEAIDPSLVGSHRPIVRQTFLPSKAVKFQRSTMAYFEHRNNSTDAVRKCRLELLYTVGEDGRLTVRRFLSNSGGKRVELERVVIDSEANTKVLDHEDGGDGPA